MAQRGKRILAMAIQNNSPTETENVAQPPLLLPTNDKHEGRSHYLSNLIAHMESILEIILEEAFSTSESDFFNLENMLILDESLLPLPQLTDSFVEQNFLEISDLTFEVSNLPEEEPGDHQHKKVEDENQVPLDPTRTSSEDRNNSHAVSENMELESEEMFVIDTSSTKIGGERKRKKFVKNSKERKLFNSLRRMKIHCVKNPYNCKMQCGKNFTADIREKINTKYWKMNFFEKKLFISNHIETGEIKRRRNENQNKEIHTKKVNKKYFLKGVNAQRFTVCKIFFLTTLGYAGNNDTVLRFTSPTQDRRGTHVRKNVVDKKIIRTHIESFSPCVSHYRREHAPNKLYLPSDVTIKMMYDNFVEKYPNERVSYDVYRIIVTKDLNISFTKLGNEECEKCEAFSLHNADHNKENIDMHPSCEDCCVWKSHINKAQISREAYRKDAENAKVDSETLFYSCDLQKVIMLPRLDMFKRVIFTPRIIVFNQSFVPLGKMSNHREPYAVLWHEAISGRKKEDITSAFNAFITCYARDFKNIVIWADNCTAQNKNWCFFSFLVYIINSGGIAADSITIKYFEPGHTFMSADSFHHLVEQGLRKKKKCYDFQDFIDVVRNCKTSRVVVKEMQFSDFKNWPNFTSNYQLQKLKGDRPFLKNISVIKAVKGKQNLYYKEHFDDEFKELNFLLAKFKSGTLPEPTSYSQNRGITEERKKNIVEQMSDIMPAHNLLFWKTLSVNNTAKNLICNIEDE